MSSTIHSSSIVSPSLSTSSVVGNAVVLLNDWERFGLCERTSLHFDWIEAILPPAPATEASSAPIATGHRLGGPSSQHLGEVHQDGASRYGPQTTTTTTASSSDAAAAATSASSFCGVSALLECTPKDSRLLRDTQRRKVRSEIKQFNLRAHRWRAAPHQHPSGSFSPSSSWCHAPSSLPLKISSGSTVLFAYETTRIAFVVDASPTLTCTYGFGNGPNEEPSEPFCCPLDRLVPMARTFFESLAHPIRVKDPILKSSRGEASPVTPDPFSLANSNAWRPEIAVTVMAVFPRSASPSNSLMLVRDFRVRDAATVSLLVRKMEEWVTGPLETEIAARLAYHHSGGGRADAVVAGGMMPQYTSHLRDVLAAGDVALSTLSSAARPLIVLASDARSLSVDAMMVDVVADPDRVDVPLIVLDLSTPQSHSVSVSDNPTSLALDLAPVGGRRDKSYHMLSYDPTGPTFPLFLSDDADALYGICKAAGGAFFDWKLLEEAAKTISGKVAVESPFLSDHIFSVKRHSIRANAIQWYTLFSLSPLTPVSHPQLGRLAPPDYLRRKSSREVESRLTPSIPFQPQETGMLRSVSGVGEPPGAEYPGPSKKMPSRISTYIVNPVRIKGLLALRIKEGWRARNYGSSTSDPDKVSIQFLLPLDFGNTLYYKLSYIALPGQENLVGFANIEIDFAGEQGFVQSVKKEYTYPTGLSGGSERRLSQGQRVALKFCELLGWIRNEDLLQSYLTPLRWSDQLTSPETPFLKRLATLSELQRRRHFRHDVFDCICQGRMPYERDQGLLAEFRQDDGEQELVEAVSSWATQVVDAGARYVKIVPGNLTSYCVVEIKSCSLASRLITVSVESFGEIDLNHCIWIVDSLRKAISDLKDVRVLKKQLSPFIVSRASDRLSGRQRFLGSQQMHSAWDLVKDPDLLPLLVRRRIEIGAFLLLKFSDNHVLLAKLRSRRTPGDLVVNDSEDPGVLFQYQLVIQEDRVVVDLHMECEGGEFASLRGRSGTSMFEDMIRSLTKRDQDCAQALQNRTKLRSAFDGSLSDSEVSQSVRHLLAYASQSSLHLRFFRLGGGPANDALRVLTHETLISNSLGARVASLPASFDFHAVQVGAADWFVIAFDSDTMTIACLSTVDRIESTEESTIALRDLTFFTFTTGDLYNMKGVGEDDESEDSHVSEYLCVSEFADFVAVSHTKNYAAAAYLALVSSEHQSATSPRIHAQDFSYVFEPLDFIDVVSLVVAGDLGDESHVRSKFSSVLQSVICSVSDDIEDCFYYRGIGYDVASALHKDAESVELSEESGPLSQDGTPHDGLAQSDEKRVQEQRHHADLDSPALDPNIISEFHASPPLFVKFLLDGKPATLHDITHSGKSANVSVQLSIFRREQKNDANANDLPLTHTSAAAELSAIMNAFVSEQTLERLRHIGPSIQLADLDIANLCLKRCLDVVKSSIDVFFYSAKTDGMVLAAAPAGCDVDVEVGFRMLTTSLLTNNERSFRTYGDGLVVMDVQPGSHQLAYWSFLSFNQRDGTVVTDVYHPGGLEKASDALSSLEATLTLAFREVNQRLLLQRLHQKRLASALLIPPDDLQPDAVGPEVGTDPFRPGFFGCQAVFRNSFELFHRCATNPSQVARTVEATVLHVFAISNRRQVFVYKDEDGSVYYMRLVAEGGGAEPDGTIELLVHGVTEPGPSVTKQLTAIIQKRLLQIGVDMLSSVLTKNPSYTWRHPDLVYVRTFEATWNSIDPNSGATWDRDRFYEFPDEVLFDPAMTLLCLRQNLCGSTYIHKLNSGDARSGVTLDDGMIKLDDLGLVFYYNNAPSKLDPKLQHISTLTSKGQEYAIAAGSGMAIIELDLISPPGEAVDRLLIGTQRINSPLASLSPQAIRFKRVEDGTSHGSRIKVTITGTALNANILHEWVLLSLNQTLLSWAIERHLESIQVRPLLDPPPSNLTVRESSSSIDDLAPGLTSFTELLTTAHATPHPSVLKCDLEGVVRSSTVATAALELLEKIIDKQRTSASIIRLSRDEVPRKVDLRWVKKGHSAAAFDLTATSSGSLVTTDAPIDCPEYICFYYTTEYSAEGRDVGGTPPKLFEAVTLSDGSGNEPIQALLDAQTLNPALFRRSSAFVFSIKRNRRILLAYNWTPQHFKHIVTRLRERNSSFLSAAYHSSHSLQIRCLGQLSPLPTTLRSVLSKAPEAVALPSESGDSEHQGNSSKPPEPSIADEPRVTGRRAIRPVAIRRPILIGKSVEGAAVHAVAASRARASANMFRPNPATAASSARRFTADEPRTGPSVLQVKMLPERGKSTLSSVSEPGADELNKLKREYRSSFAFGTGKELRLHCQQQKAMLKMGALLVPSKRDREGYTPLPSAAASFLLSRLCATWSDVVELTALPSVMRAKFLPSFAHAVSKCLPSFSVLPFANASGRKGSTCVLLSDTRAVHYCRCMAFISLELIEMSSRCFVRSVEWVLTKPRHSTRAKNRQRAVDEQILHEKDSAGLDVLASESHSMVSLRRLLFDFVSSYADREATTTGDARQSMDLARGVLALNGLSTQIKVLRSNYNVYESQIILSSYGDPLIDTYEATALLQWLVTHADCEGVVGCGSQGICFQRQVQCRGTYSTIFLRSNPTAKDRFVLMVLCRTEGRNLRECFFPGGSIFGVSIMDYVAIEAAGMIYNKLKAAATRLHLADLWKLASTKKRSRDDGHSGSALRNEILELMQLCIVTPLAEVLDDPMDSHQLALVLKGSRGVDWRRCAKVMGEDQAFFPAWPLLDDNEGDDVSILYYLKAEDVFLHFATMERGENVQLSLVHQSEMSVEHEKFVSLAQKLSNYFLHFVWSEILVL